MIFSCDLAAVNFQGRPNIQMSAYEKDCIIIIGFVWDASISGRRQNLSFRSNFQ